MPRSARIDIPHLLQHVVVRGIENRHIFTADEDRSDFVARFSRLLVTTETDCLAWSLMPDHFHILVRVKETPLSLFMRRLLTGYAVSFNHRHDRSGHLFNNRYRSVVCDEDEYLAELVRHVHLNPLRSGTVADLAELDLYPWSGHGVILGNNQMPGQNTSEVLSRFGRSIDEARRSYHLFVRNGIGLGSSGEFSAVGRPGGKRDLRVLGDEEFVEQVVGHCRRALHEPTIPLDRIIEAVLKALDIEEPELLSRSRTVRVAEARAIICHIAFNNGHRGVDIAQRLRISGPAVTVAVGRGKEAIKKYPGISADAG